MAKKDTQAAQPERCNALSKYLDVCELPKGHAGLHSAPAGIHGYTKVQWDCATGCMAQQKPKQKEK